MNADELKEKMQKLIKEFGTDRDNDDYVVFVLISNTEEYTSVSFGVGCPACSADRVSLLNESGEFKHTGARKDVH